MKKELWADENGAQRGFNSRFESIRGTRSTKISQRLFQIFLCDRAAEGGFFSGPSSGAITQPNEMGG